MKALLAAVILLSCSIASAQDAPSAGILYSTKETSSITFSCNRKASAIDCEFVQVSVRKKLKPEDIDANFGKILADYRKNGWPISADECKANADLMDILEGRSNAPKPERFATASELERRDVTNFGRLFVAYCGAKTEANFIAFVRASQLKDTRTCKVSTNTFSQSFRYVRDSTNQGSWIVHNSPAGPCGTVQLSRFELDPERKPELRFWRYIARKAVTNPGGTLLPGMTCKDLDEGEYLYDWRSREVGLGCDYIEFSVL